MTSPSAPNINDASFWIDIVPLVVSSAFDFKKFAAAVLPNASASVDVPVNLASDIAVDRLTPLAIDANPVIAVCGVNATVEVIETIVSFTKSCITDLATPVSVSYTHLTLPTILRV